MPTEGDTTEEGGGVVVGTIVKTDAEPRPDTSKDADIAKVTDSSGKDGTPLVGDKIKFDDQAAEGVHSPVEDTVVNHLGFSVRRVSKAHTTTSAAEEDVQHDVKGNEDVYGQAGRFGNAAYLSCFLIAVNTAEENTCENMQHLLGHWHLWEKSL